MTGPRHVAVIDIGKTNAKVALVDLASRTEAAVRRLPNRALHDGPYPHFDIDLLWEFILDGLATIADAHPIDAVSITTHGVAAALVDAAGQLALPVLDYEFDMPASARESYDSIRPDFRETGSPRLPLGLNLGAQIHWQASAFPQAFAGVRWILTYPQYWAYRLSGSLASEATSLGCHSDMWCPAKADYSSLVDLMGWRRLMPPMRRASEMLGTVDAAIARRTGLSPDVPVACGIHDSNASLLPHLLSRRAPFSVVSTGTWVISMAIGGSRPALDPNRDTLVNVSALGEPVPSARFMGGREYSTLLGDAPAPPTEADAATVVDGSLILLPSVESGSGPFPKARSRWLDREPALAGEKHAAVSFYLAMMTATCLDLVGGRGETIVEGPFASNACFSGMLATATGRAVIASAGSTGTSIGAALLATGDPPAAVQTDTGISFQPRPEWRNYCARWTAAAG